MLFLAADFPLPVASGSQIRQMNLLKSFSREFEVTFVTPSMNRDDHQYLPELKRYAHKVIPILPANKRSFLHRVYYKMKYWLRRVFLGDSKDRFYNAMPNVTRTVVEELRRQKYDVLFTIYWYWDSRIWDTSALKVIDANDVQSHRVERLLERSSNPFERLMRGFLLRRYQQMEAATLCKADLIVAITERDREHFEQMTGGTVDQVVIATGLDTDWFTPEGEPESHHVAFFGALRNPMNRDAVVHLIEDVLPALRKRFPQLRLTLVGAGAPREIQSLAASDPGIHLTGYVEDIRKPLRTAAAVLLPLRIGWGIRGRVFEVMSLGVPVIASSVATAGMGLCDGDGVIFANTPAEFVDALAPILEDPHRRREIGARGRKAAVEHASIAATYGRLATLLAERCRLVG